MSQNNNTQRNGDALENFSKSINYKKYLIYLLSNWYWIVLSIATALGLVYLYNSTTPNIYKVETTLIFNDQPTPSKPSSNRNLGSLTLIKEINQFDQANNIELMKSYKIVRKTIQKLDFNISYYKKNRFFDEELHKDAPFRIMTTKEFSSYGRPIIIKLLSKDKYKLIINGDFNAEYTLKYGKPFSKHGLSFRLFRNPDYSGKISKETTYCFRVHKTRTLAKAYHEKLTVTTHRDNPNIVMLSSTGPIPEKEAEFLQALVETYTHYMMDRINETATNSIQFIDQQLSKIDRRLLRYENQLQSMRNEDNNLEYNYISSKQRENSNYSQGGSVSSFFYNELSRLRNNKMLLQEDKRYFTSLRELVENNRNLDSIVLPSTTVVEADDLANLLEELAHTQQEIKNSDYNLEPNHPIYKNLQSKYKEQKKSLMTKVNLYADYIDNNINTVESKIQEMEREIPSYPAKERQYQEIQRRIGQNEEVMATLSQRKIEFEIIKASQTPNFEVLQEARPEDAYLAHSNSRIYYLMAWLMGLALPVSILLGLKSNASRIQEKEEIKSHTSLSILHAIEHNTFHETLPVFHYPQSSITDSFRYIRTNLMFRLKDHEVKVIMISSMVSGEGKSFLTSNLGAALAMGGFKTVIISADIRKPSLQKIFPKTNDLGLSDYLTNNSKHTNIIQDTKIDNLFIISPGKNISNPGDLLIPKKIDTLLDYLSTRFEYILFDSPPFSMVPEAVIIGERANCNIFVLRHNYSPKTTLEHLNEIKNEGRLNNIFLIINDIKRMKGFGFEYYFGYDSIYNFGYYDQYYNNKKTPINSQI